MDFLGGYLVRTRKKKEKKKKKRIYIREMLTNVLRVLVNNQFKESFYKKRKEKKRKKQLIF